MGWRSRKVRQSLSTVAEAGLIMCGIAGHAVPPEFLPLAASVRAATRRLAHRGPDGEGFAELPQVCLGHRRLGVIDLAGSNQPWVSSDRRYTMVFNGEIYNYLELRKPLEALGVHFRSAGDTEVLMESYRHWGEGCLTKLNGMFSFAIWDRDLRRLFLARDRVGKKPLYYTALPEKHGGGLAFASELSALAVFPGVGDAVDSQAVSDYFAYQYIPFDRTIFSGAHKLPPGHSLTWEAGQTTVARYWQPPHPETAMPRNGCADEGDFQEELRALVDDATRLRLRADVPLGAFLSGGVDSAIVVSSIQRQCADLHTYTIGFDDATFDERDTARASASHFGTHHHEQVFHLDPEKLLPRLVSRFGEPFADISALPTWYLCQEARKTLTVALSGDGGDELFGGYRRYLAGRWVDSYLRWPKPLRGIMETLVARLPDSDSYFGKSRLKQLKLFLDLSRRHAASPQDCLPQIFSLAERLALLQPDMAPAADNNVISRFGLEKLGQVERMMLADLQAYLSEDILTKVDRVSMDHSLEVRSPLLDYRVVEFACRLPLRDKIRGATQKWLLKKAFAERLPEHVLRSPKQGFAVPVGRLLRNGMKKTFEDQLFISSGVYSFIRQGEVERLWGEHQSGRRDHGLKLWTILTYAYWFHSWENASK